jgi:hypothetical protein
MVPEIVLKEIVNHNIEFVEEPHPQFDNLPVCPFAKKARMDDQIQYETCNLNISDMLTQIEAWRLTGKEILTLVILDKEMHLSDYVLHFGLIKATLPVDLIIFDGHPQSTFMYRNVLTRQEPYPNFQIMRLIRLEEAEAQMEHGQVL